ncbi:MAG: hypothetical protein ACRCSQ_04270, partial [Bacteroidales bacterium]
VSARGAADVTIENTVFTQNMATAKTGLAGGALLMEQSSFLKLDGCTLSENKALNGAAIAVNGSKWDKAPGFGKVDIHNTLIEKSNLNTIFQEKGSDGKVKTLYAAFGGAVYFDGGGTAGTEVNLVNCTLDNNHAKEAAAIFADKAATLNMTGCVVSNNAASCQFAAMKYNGIGTTGRLKDCDIRGSVFYQVKEYNMMTVFAGSGAILNIENSLIRDNKETEERKSAVAFGVRGGGTMNLVNSTITGNSGRNLAFIDGKVDIDGKTVFSSLNLISCTVVDNPECVQSEKLFHKDKICFIHSYNSIFANNLVKGAETTDAFNTFKNSVLGKKVHDAEGAVIADLEFDRKFMMSKNLVDKGGKTMVFELEPHEPEEELPNWAVTNGMNAAALAALAPSYPFSEEILKADQRGVQRAGTCMGAYTEGVFDSLEQPVMNTESSIYSYGNTLVVENVENQVKVEVFTMNGSKVYDSVLPAGKHNIELSAKGIYIVKAGNKVAKVAM